MKSAEIVIGAIVTAEPQEGRMKINGKICIYVVAELFCQQRQTNDEKNKQIIMSIVLLSTRPK